MSGCLKKVILTFRRERPRQISGQDNNFQFNLPWRWPSLLYLFHFYIENCSPVYVSIMSTFMEFHKMHNTMGRFISKTNTNFLLTWTDAWVVDRSTDFLTRHNWNKCVATGGIRQLAFFYGLSSTKITFPDGGRNGYNDVKFPGDKQMFVKSFHICSI